MAKTPSAVGAPAVASRIDYSSKAKEQGLRLVPDPDRHIDISHVPEEVTDKVAACISHSAQVVQRGIALREKRLVSSLGNAWDLKQSLGKRPYYLKCVRSDICDSFECVANC